MSMDLVTYASGIHSTSIVHRMKRLFRDNVFIPPPPTIVTDKGLAYVDIYIKVFYLNDEVSKSFNLFFCTLIILYDVLILP